MPLLSIKKLTKTFGGLAAVTNVDMSVEEGEIVGLIGPNGAGKTTVFNLLTGIYVPTSGTIEFDTGSCMKKLNGMKPNAITRLGIARTFQNIRLFKNISVQDNIRIAIHKNIKYGLHSALFRLPSFHNEEAQILEKTRAFLDIFKLDDKRNELARNLPYGEQRRLEVARALATGARLLLLDEPAAGMNPNETLELTRLIEWIRKEFKLTIILIEHDMSVVMNICEKIYVLDYGMVIAEGKPEEIKTNRRVIEAYLGEEVSDA